MRQLKRAGEDADKMDVGVLGVCSDQGGTGGQMKVKLRA